MLNLKRVSVLLVIMVLSGCVSKAEYLKRMGDIDNLKQEVSTRDEAISRLEADKTVLEADLAKLEKEHEKANEDIRTLSDLLRAKKDELSVQVAALRDQLAGKENALSAKNNEIEALNREKNQAIQEKEKSIAELKKTYNSLVGEMSEEIKKGAITITQLKDKLSVNMVDEILFDSGSAEIKKEGKKVIDRVAGILLKVTDKQVRVEGYTDDVPISSRLAARFPTNWELSTARATTVARHLQDKGIDPTLLSAAGYSEYRPVAPNDTEEGRAKNRRIEISLIPKEI